MSRETPGGEDEDEGSRRTFVNLLSAIAILVIAIALIWAYLAFEKQQKLERCVNSGRRDCIEMADPSAAVPRTP